MAVKSNPDVEAPADAPPVADAVPAVEAPAPEAVAAAQPEVQAPTFEDLWQTDARVPLTYTGASGKVYIPFGELQFGATVPVPATLVASYLATKSFIPAAA